MEDLFKDTICLATVARDLKERANIAEQQYQEGQISAAEKEKILQTLDKVQCVPIVPRKILEMVIEKCKQDVEDLGRWQNQFDQGRANEAEHIEAYAESLLNQFEEGKWEL